VHARILSSHVPRFEGQEVTLEGWVHRLRRFGSIGFLVLRDRSGIAQVVLPPQLSNENHGPECVVRVQGTVRKEARASGGFEVLAGRVETISPAEPPPIEINNPRIREQCRLETLLDHRPLSLRAPAVLDIFKVQAEILRSFRGFLNAQGFTEIVTPKLVLAGAEGGSALFEVDYYGGKACLNQSPQFYKQMMVGSGFERVFEVGHAYRAEKSETSRHLTEFVSLDFEMGFIEGEQDVMRMHGNVIREIFRGLRENCAAQLVRYHVELPDLEEIPQLNFEEARRILAERFGKREGLEGDLDTEGERLIGEWASTELKSPLLFVTGYAIEKRPAYTMAQSGEPRISRSFDLLYNGVEITTGGQRIHNHAALVESFQSRGLVPEQYEDYFSIFKHGMPPHGGMGMGLERLTRQLLNLANVKEASLFPRDRYRLRP
jgi:nondiscriminating aspartyl-tRNA synthetase